MSTVGIIGAMEVEVETLKKAHEGEKNRKESPYGIL